MAFTYDITTDTGKMRAIIPDTNATGSHLFEDAELAAFLAIEGNSVKRGAALAVETIATNEALVLKVIKLLDLTTDGAKLSDALLKRAALLRQQANDEEFAVSGGAFDVAEQVFDDFTARERLRKQLQRLGYL